MQCVIRSLTLDTPSNGFHLLDCRRHADNRLAIRLVLHVEENCMEVFNNCATFIDMAAEQFLEVRFRRLLRSFEGHKYTLAVFVANYLYGTCAHSRKLNTSAGI